MESKPAKKKNQKQKEEKKNEPLVIDGQTVPEDPVERAKWVEDQRTAYITKMQAALDSGKGNMSEVNNIKQRLTLAKEHKFWDNQPVRHMFDLNQIEVTKDRPVIKSQDVSKVSKEPEALPNGFEWVTVDLENDIHALMVFTLLRENYVEDLDGNFRNDYPVDFLRWQLLTPSHNKNWFIGVVASGKPNKLLAFISALPNKVTLNGDVKKMATVNFLCIHKKLRQKRLAPVLIKELTRRVNLENTWQAAFASGDTFPFPYAQAMYYHRSLNTVKNVEVGFTGLQQGQDLQMLVKKEKLQPVSEIHIIGDPRPMVSKDISDVYQLYKKQMEKYQISIKYTQAELAHLLMPRSGVVYTIVVEARENGKIIDFISFYNMPVQVLKKVSGDHTRMNVAYLYYYGLGGQNTLENLVKYALIYAKEMADVNFDVFNALQVMDNREFIDNCKFGMGDGCLNYYLFNWLFADGGLA